MVKHKIAKGVMKWYMELFSFQGWTSFWNTVYYKNEDCMKNSNLIRHELKHIEQIKREGRLKFFFKYVYYNMKYGYKNNPFEIEARQNEL